MKKILLLLLLGGSLINPIQGNKECDRIDSVISYIDKNGEQHLLIMCILSIMGIAELRFYNLDMPENSEIILPYLPNPTNKQ